MTENCRCCKHITDEFNKAINFALDEVGIEGTTFLALWREGAWEEIAKNWPEFEITLRSSATSIGCCVEHDCSDGCRDREIRVPVNVEPDGQAAQGATDHQGAL